MSRQGNLSLSEKVKSLHIPDGDKPIRSSRAAWMLCLVFVSTTLWFGYQSFQPTHEDAKSTQSRSADWPAVQAKLASPGRIAFESKGYVVPTRQILVTPQVSGRLVRLGILEGQSVTHGQVLAEIERTEYEADYNCSRAALARAQEFLRKLNNGARPEEIEQANKELEEARVRLHQLQRDDRSNSSLLKRNAISAREFQQNESEMVAMSLRVEQLRSSLSLLHQGPREEEKAMALADVKLCTAECEKAKWRLDNCTIVAPISGTVLKKNAEEGNIVNPLAFNGSYSLCEIADLDQLEVELKIPERDLSLVFQDQRCEIRVDAFPGRTYDGHVTRLMPIADRAKAALPIRVKISVPANEEGAYLKPEMGVTVSFLRQADDKIAAIRSPDPE